MIKKEATMRWAPYIVLGITLAIVAISLRRVIVAYQDYPYFFDEAIHANGGLALAVDVWNRNLLGFLQTFYSQGFYPPTFSVFKAFAYVFFGPTTLVARSFSLLSLIIGQLVIFFFARQVYKNTEIDKFASVKGGWVGLTAVLLTLTSLPLLNASTQVMLEAPSLLISFVFLWLYFQSFIVEKASRRQLVSTSLVLVAVFLTKYTYGLAMVGTVGLMELSFIDWRGSDTIFAKIKGKLNRWLWLVAPFVVCLLIWLGTSYKFGEFFGYITAQPNEAQWSWEQLVFYPRNIVFQQLPSPLFGAVSLLGLGWGLTKWNRPGIRLLLIYFGVGMLEMLLNFPKIPRFITTFLPAAHMLTGLMLVSILWQKKWNTLHWILAGITGLSLLWAVPVLFGRYSTLKPLMQAQMKTAPAVNDIPQWVDEQIPDDSRFYIVNFFELVNMESLAWGMIADGGKRSGEFEDYHMPGGLLKEPTAENIEAFRQDVLKSDVDFILVIEGGDWGRGWPAYDRNLSDLVEYHAHREFPIEVVNRPYLLWTTMIDQSVADYVLDHEKGVFNLKLLIYKVKR
ncbi:MAG: hypothetical protein ACI9EW_000085 [Cellvibrionaceae bacterium]